MLVKTTRFVSLLCAALALELTLSHDLEIPGKQHLSGAEWLVVQQTSLLKNSWMYQPNHLFTHFFAQIFFK
jgi:hypothetical protein